MVERAVPAFFDLLSKERGKTTVVVAHGVINRVLLLSILLTQFTPADFDKIPIDFVGVHDLRLRGNKIWLEEYWPGDPTPPLHLSQPRP